MHTKNANDIKETISELVDKYHVVKHIIAGTFMTYGFGKKPEEFNQLIELLLKLSKESIIFEKELEES